MRTTCTGGWPPRRVLQRLREWAKSLQRDVLALWFACRDPRTPSIAKLLTTLIVVYALSPIDLIPDFIPVLGFLDELILLPGAIYLVIRLIPVSVLDHAREQARDWLAQRNPEPRSYAGAAIVIAIWLGLLWMVWAYVRPLNMLL